MRYDKLLIKYQGTVKIKEKPLKYGLKGLYKDGKILIDSNIETDSEKSCILCEELGHHYTSYGDIIDQSDVRSAKQENRARAWAYEKQVGIVDLINAHRRCIKGNYALAEFFNVPEWFLIDAIEYYKRKYGTGCKIDNYIICFEPRFGVIELF